MIRNCIDLIVLVENQIGWDSAHPGPLWKQRAIEASRLKSAIAVNPTLYTWRNLELAVALLVQKKTNLRSPLGVLAYVEEAVSKANPEPTPVPLTEAIEAAIRHEETTRGPDWELWATRLTRASGVGRTVALSEWHQARG